MKTRLTSAIAASALAAISMTQVGCQGHGKYTQEHLDKATLKMNGMKAGNEYESARQAFLAGELDKAIGKVDKSISLNPNVAKTFVLRGRILIERGDLDGAGASLAEAERLEPENVEAQYYTGIVLERFNQREQALSRYLRASELDASNPQYPIAAAEMLIDLKRLDQANEFLIERTQRFEHHAGVRQTLGHIATLKGDNVKALEYFNEAYLMAPDDPVIVEDLIRSQIANSKFADAESLLARMLAVAANADRRDLRHMRAQCLTALNRPVDARELYLGLTNEAAGSSDEDAWIGLGNSAYTLRDFARVRMSAQRVVSLAPERYEGHLFKALWHKHQGELIQALDSATKAVQRRQASADPLVVQGLIYQDLQKPAEAKACFAQAFREDPANRMVGELLNNVSSQSRTAEVTESHGD